MTQRSFEQVVLRPVVSEKSYGLMARGQYVFECVHDAEKVEVKRALATMFPDVTVVAVNTSKIRGKTRNRSRRGGMARISGNSVWRKKVIVTLAPGQKIEGLFEGV